MILKKLSPFQISTIGHASVAVVLLLFSLDLFKPKTTVNVPLEVITNPVVVSPQLQLQPKNITPPAEKNEPIPEVKKVFGVSRKAITDDTGTSGVQVKQGNTVAKEMDQLKLDKNDPDSIPIPADDYLITSGAKLKMQVVANRTEEARKAGYTGTAILLIIIDKDGSVKKAELLNSLDYGLNERALEIVKNLKFEPARVKDEPVATQIRFSINFKSTN